jgi:hypothetical protein
MQHRSPIFGDAAADALGAFLRIYGIPRPIMDLKRRRNCVKDSSIGYFSRIEIRDFPDLDLGGFFVSVCSSVRGVKVKQPVSTQRNGQR